MESIFQNCGNISSRKKDRQATNKQTSGNIRRINTKKDIPKHTTSHCQDEENNFF